VPPTIEWHKMMKAWRLLEEKRKELNLFQRHKAKLAWTLVYVANLIHKSSMLHNDLSPMNIMLHYPNYSNEIINIGICDSRISSRFDENAPSHYGKSTKAKMDHYKRGTWWVALELFYIFGHKDSDTSIPIRQQHYKYTEKSYSYSIEKLTK